MAIQMRRGNAVDFNPAKMVPGEWAVSQDNQKVYMCFAPGQVVEIGSAGTIIPYVLQAEAWAAGTKDREPVSDEEPQYHNNSKYYSERAQYIVDHFEEQFPHASTERPTGANYVKLIVTDVGGTTETNIYDGPTGATGPMGPSPDIIVEAIAGGHRVTIIDEDHPTGQSFDVLDGAGSGDMRAAIYDSTSAVATAGGIVAYVTSVMPAAQIQSDWSQTNTSAKDYIKHKPTIPTVDQTYDSTSANAQSGAAVKQAVDAWTQEATVTSNGTVTFSGIDDREDYGYEPVCKITNSSTNKNPSFQISSISGTTTSNMSVTFTTDADTGAKVKLRILR